MDLMRPFAYWPGYKLIHGLWLWFPLSLHDGGAGLTMSLLDQCLVLVFDWAHCGLTRVCFCLTDCEGPRPVIVFP